MGTIISLEDRDDIPAAQVSNERQFQQQCTLLRLTAMKIAKLSNSRTACAVLDDLCDEIKILPTESEVL